MFAKILICGATNHTVFVDYLSPSLLKQGASVPIDPGDWHIHGVGRTLRGSSIHNLDGIAYEKVNLLLIAWLYSGSTNNSLLDLLVLMQETLQFSVGQGACRTSGIGSQVSGRLVDGSRRPLDTVQGELRRSGDRSSNTCDPSRSTDPCHQKSSRLPRARFMFTGDA